jgi:PAS domain S-box-containing protein
MEWEEKYKTIFETTGSATAIIEEDTTISMANAEFLRLSGYSKKELEGKKSWQEFISKDDLEKMKEYHQLRRIDPNAAPRNYDAKFIDRQGRAKDVFATVDIIPGTQQSVISFMDITERKQAEEQVRLQQQQLIQADKLATLGILVSGIAHEINNPLNFILLNAKIASRVWNEITPILQEYFETRGDFPLAGMPYTKAHDRIGQLISGISEGAARIEKIVTGLKIFSRQDQGDPTQSVEINAVVESALVIVNDLVKKATHYFYVNYGKNLPAVRGNYQRLEQVIINLITNSCHALASKDKKISVATSLDKQGGGIRIIIADEGEGLPSENLKHVLDPFFTTKRNSGGTGLGLSISYNIIKNHGGDLRLTSKPGEGTRAEIILPLKPPSGKEEAN